MTDDVDEIEDTDTSEAPASPEVEVPQRRQGSKLSAEERSQFIGRIAILTAHNARLERELTSREIAIPATPRLDEVRPTILAEGVVAQLKSLQAELRLAEQDLAEGERERNQLRAELDRARASGAGGGAKASAPPPVDVELARKLERDLGVLKEEIRDHLRQKASLKDELAAAKRGRDEATDQLRKEQLERARLEKQVRGLGDEVKAAKKAPAQQPSEDDWAALATDCGLAPAPSTRDEFVDLVGQAVEKAGAAGVAAGVEVATDAPGDPEILLGVLRIRGDAVTSSFLRDFLACKQKRVDVALEQLVADERVRTTKLGKFTQYRATP